MVNLTRCTQCTFKTMLVVSSVSSVMNSTMKTAEDRNSEYLRATRQTPLFLWRESPPGHLLTKKNAKSIQTAKLETQPQLS